MTKKDTNNPTNIQPLGTRVLIDPIASDDVSKGGILLPEQAVERSHKGKVLAVGAEVKDVKPGQVVLISKYSGAPLRYAGKEYFLVSEDNVIAVEE